MSHGRSTSGFIRTLSSRAFPFKGMHRSVIERTKSKFSQSVNAVSDTYFSIKDVFERHRIVLTLAASLASAGAAWTGYAARQLHQRKVEERLDTIEHVMTTVHNLEERQVKALTNANVSFTSCVATAGTTLVIGYGLGFRGGRFYTMKKIQRQQQKLLTPKRFAFWDFRKQFKPTKWNKVHGVSKSN